MKILKAYDVQDKVVTAIEVLYTVTKVVSSNGDKECFSWSTIG